MIAQPILTTGPKPPAQQQQHAPNAGDFQSLLSPTDSSLMDLGASAITTHLPANAQQAANASKPKSNDANPAPYVAAPTQPSAGEPGQTPPALPADGKALDANGIPNNAVIPAADAAATDQSSNNGNSTAFGADVLNARIVAGAPIYASQPNASMVTVPPHLLDAANTHPLPGEPAGKPGNEPSGKAPADANTVLPPSANAEATPAAPALSSHPAVAATGNSIANSGDNGGTPAQTGDNNASQTSDNASTSSASLLEQPNQPQAAPIQIDGTIHTAAPYVPVGEQVALNLKQAIAADNNEIRIQLKPASLGTIDVKLNVGQDGRVNAVISADRSDTLNMLKQDAGALQQALRDAGLNADGNSLSFNLSGNAQSFAQSWSQGGSNSSSNAYANAASDALLGTDPVAPAQRLHAGALDIEV